MVGVGCNELSLVKTEGVLGREALGKLLCDELSFVQTVDVLGIDALVKLLCDGYCVDILTELLCFELGMTMGSLGGSEKKLWQQA